MPEDTTGNSHVTRSVDGQQVMVAWIPLRSDQPELTRLPEDEGRGPETST